MTPDDERPSRRHWSLGLELIVEVWEDSPLCPAMDTVFGAMAVETLDSTTTTPVRLRLDGRAAGGSVLFVDSTAITKLTARDHLPPLLESLVVGLAVRTFRACVAFHGACVSINGKGVLLTGDKGSGKSVLSAHLASPGSYLGDEVAFIKPGSRQIVPFPKAATIKEGAFSLFPRRETYHDPVRGPLRYITPRTASTHRDTSHTVDQVLVPVFDPEATSPELVPSPPEPLALGLVQQCFGGLERGPNTMSLIADLVSRPHHILRFARSEDALPLILELVA